MLVRLAYGERGLDVDLPEGTIVLEPHPAPSIPDVNASVLEAIEHPLETLPLRVLARGAGSAAIVVSDVTRPVPNAVLLPPLLEALRVSGVPRDRTTIIIGTGMHRASTPEERVRVLGAAIADAYVVVDHDARDKTALSYLTTSARGVEVWLNRHYVNADIRIVVGFVEPHLFAGYSGGGKGIVPGIAGEQIIMSNHGADMLAHPKATWCITVGNPIFEEQRDLALASKPTLALQVTLNQHREVTGVFAGELAAAHAAAIALAERQYTFDLHHPFDIVVSTNMGYPADLNFYQSVKGMSVAALAVKHGGAIVLAAECREGLGQPDYAALLASQASPAALLEQILSADAPRYDQWQVQVQAMAQAKAGVWLHSSMPRHAVQSAHVHYCDDVSVTVEALRRAHVERHGKEPSVLALPHGQLTVPRVPLVS